MKNLYLIILANIVIFSNCNNATPSDNGFIIEKSEPMISEDKIEPKIKVGAEMTEDYLPLLEDKNVGIIANQTSTIGSTHVVDSLLANGINLIKIFCPEHGFRGKADAGEIVTSETDSKTGLPIISLYGNNKKPKSTDLENLNTIIFDLQDVGARFYTYISSMHYVMEACAENHIELIIFDRPNPNGHYIDGPVLDTNFRSFIGMHTVPVVHGMTIGEYAQMINGEGWLKGGLKCDLKVISCKNYNHNSKYKLPVKPSPNLPNARSVELYPSLCFFEGTDLSIGRGTDMQFQVVGHPLLKNVENIEFSYTPEPNEGSKHPKHSGQTCFGFDFRIPEEKFSNGSGLNLNYLLYVYQIFPEKEKFFLNTNMFNLLAGNDILKKQLIEGKTEDEIRTSWQKDLKQFKSIRKKYLLYKDFE